MINLNKNILTKTILLSGIAGAMMGCMHEENDSTVTPSVHYAVITTQASDNSSGDISIISLEDYSTDNSNFSGGSDTVISTHEGNLYRIGRFQQDNITKLSIDDPEIQVWQYSTNGEGEEKTNPYKLVVKNDTTGYLIRYGHAKVWIVDPTAESHESFKVGEIDLSDYAGDDEIPEVTDVLLIGDKLYFLMQNLDRNNGWVPGQAYLSVYNTSDNTEVETNTNAESPKGIQLTVTNPNKMEYLSTTSTIYISGVGPYFPADYSGGIEAVKLSDYSTEIIVDDGDVDNHPYGQINNLAILNSTRGYFVGYSAWQDTAVYSFNPTTGEVDTTALMENKDISDIEIGPLGNLWVTNRNESGITIIDTVDNSVFNELIDTDLVPSDIEFISVPKSD